MEGRQAGLEPLDRADDLSSLSGEVEAVGRVIAQCNSALLSPTVIGQLEELGARVVHVYGLTETYGPYTVCEWQAGWEGQQREARARLLARQGVAMVISDPVRVVDEDLRDVVGCRNPFMQLVRDTHGAGRQADRGGVHDADLL